MQSFIDTVTQHPYFFDDDVKVVNSDGVYSFTTSHGMPLSSLPMTLQPYVIPVQQMSPTVLPTVLVEQQIRQLENTITPRRIREAVLTGDHSFIQGVDTQITALRATLTKTA